MNISPKVQKIIEWRDSLSKMPGDQFFEIVQMYLGEIKTPYNKQNLLENLGSFLKKEENQESFVKLLCNIDLKILAAIRFIPCVNQKKIEACFKSVFSKLSLAEHIANLMQRLIIYEYTDDSKNTVELRINPFLEDCILPLIPIDILLPKPSVKISRDKETFLLSPALLASFVSYVLLHPELCKADGGIKKRNAADLEEIFGTGIPCELLIKAFCNLNLFLQDGKKIFVNWDRLYVFCELPEIYQYAYLCAASCGHFSRSTLHTNAQLLYDTLLAIPKEGYERQAIINLAFLIKETTNNDSFGSKGRFAQLMAKAEGSADMTAELVMDSMIDSCVDFGLLYVGETDDKGNKIFYVPNEIATSIFAVGAKNNLLSIDAASIVTILPGLSFADFLPLIKFLTVKHYDTVVEFEISKQSVMRSFDLGMNPSLIDMELTKYSSYAVPQNVKVSIEDWNNSYASATLYKGYVLKVSKDNIVKTRNNRVLSPYIVEEVAEGIFLLNISDDSTAHLIMERSGLDFVGRIHCAEEKKEILSFMSLRKSIYSIADANDNIGNAPFKLISSIEQNKFIDDLKAEVLSMNIPLEQKEGLLDRIERRIIVNASQLNGNTVRFERLEATGMDYQGKLHIISESIQAKNLLEIRMEDEPVIIGMPVSLMKHENDADLEISMEDDSSRIIAVGKIAYLKKLKKNLSFV